MVDEGYKVYKGVSPHTTFYNVWYALSCPCHKRRYFVTHEDPVNTTLTQCLQPEEMQETSWLDLLVVKGISKQQAINHVKELECEGRLEAKELFFCSNCNKLQPHHKDYPGACGVCGHYQCIV